MDEDVRIRTKDGRVFMNYGDTIVSSDYTAAPEGVQQSIAIALANGQNKNGNIYLDQVTVNGDEVEYTHQALRALGEAILKKFQTRFRPTKRSNANIF